MKIYKCKKCENIVELIEDKKGVLTCCGETMEELIPNTVDASKIGIIIFNIKFPIKVIIKINIGCNK